MRDAHYSRIGNLPYCPRARMGQTSAVSICSSLYTLEWMAMPRSHRRKNGLALPAFASPASWVESLESRTLLAATTVSVVASIPTASESHRTTTGRGEFVFKRPTGDTTLPHSVRYAINGDSTATNGADFEVLSGKITIPAGKRGVAMNLFPINDTLHEPKETVIVSLKNQSTYSVGHRNALVTISDNDAIVTGPPVGWWDTNHHFRAPLTVNVGS